MTPSLMTSVDAAIQALHGDLLDSGGPKISTMRNYRFAILLYDPREEFVLRRRLRWLTDELKGQGWNVGEIFLNQLLLKRLKDEEKRVIDSMIRFEHRLYERDPSRALNYLKEKIAPYLEGPDGIAQDIIATIAQFADSHPTEANRTVIFLRRTGALYPFFRSSALLKHLDGKTQNLPVILLYPGTRQDLKALSFMGELPSDRDYRPRVYS